MPPQAITIFFASCIYPSLTHTSTKKTLIINAAKSVTGTKHPKSIFAQRFTTQHDFSSLLFFLSEGEHVDVIMGSIPQKKWICM